MIEGRHAPSLVYVFVFAESDGAWTFRGSLPRDVSEAAKSASLDLPSEFTAFYQTVHNGFQDVMEAELMPFMSTTMGKLVSEEDAFGRSKKKPYVLADLIPIYNTGSGDYICLDKQSSTSAKVIGGTYDHESPRDSVFNKDVKSLIDQRFEIALTNYASPER